MRFFQNKGIYTILTGFLKAKGFLAKMNKVIASEMPLEKTAYKTFDHQNIEKFQYWGDITQETISFDIGSHWHLFSLVSCVII